jgi:membrane protein YqaA with SNARE-associated domain
MGSAAGHYLARGGHGGSCSRRARRRSVAVVDEASERRRSGDRGKDILLMPLPASYASLFVLSFLAATVLPLSSEVALAALVGVQGQLVAPVLVATAGNVLGACTTYWLGRKAANALVRRRVTSRKEERAARLLRRYGGPALLLSWVPILGDALVALAGVTKLPLRAFLFWVTLGKGARYAVVAWTVSGL